VRYKKVGGQISAQEIRLGGGKHQDKTAKISGPSSELKGLKWFMWIRSHAGPTYKRVFRSLGKIL
jgi:hypothetical protein